MGKKNAKKKKKVKAVASDVPSASPSSPAPAAAPATNGPTTSPRPDTPAQSVSQKLKKKAEPEPPPEPMSPIVRSIGKGFLVLAFVAALFYFGRQAHEIRMYAIRTYGLVIHEFDPWFNYRATEYLHKNGLYEFFHWFDHMSWYPLGRPVGTTIYPGMQMTSVGIWKVLNDYVGYEMSLNDICCYVPVWFGVSATVFLALLTRETTGSWAAGAASAGIMAVIPAHIMRSIGGGYDNESIALTAMCATFYLWVRSLRADPKLKNGEPTRDSYIFGVLAGLAYVNMAAAWGGFIFVINMIAFHAGLLVAMGRYSSKLHRAYSLFYVVGTLGAMQIPVVGWRPLQSLEQLGGLVAFLGLQFLEYCEIQRRRNNLSWTQVFQLRVKLAGPLVVGAIVLASILNGMGYFGPLGSRIRGLFVKHTRTGNPLVDSVAEHQPASEAAYEQHLLRIYDIAPWGFLVAFIRLPLGSDANSFLVAYAGVAYYFANKMMRLIILLGPISSALGGLFIGFVIDQCFLYAAKQLLVPVIGEDEMDDEEKINVDPPSQNFVARLRLLVARKKSVRESWKLYRTPSVIVLRMAVGFFMLQASIPMAREFYTQSHYMAERMSSPSIMFKSQLRDGTEIIVDDYREGYWWLRDNTPKDTRVMAWWDYGYQIAGIAERTTIADGNTWNHEHIATLGRILTAPEKKAHKIARHLADYVLVWAGGGGDDLAKSPHLARIANSVFHDICKEPTCSEFGFYRGGEPTPKMRKALLYKLVKYGYNDDIVLDPSRWKHVFTSKYGKVRIYKIMKVSKKSKKWVADPANRVCDAPGSWYCEGQYPPALDKLIAKRKDFLQLEDFNKGQDAKSKKYQDEYHAAMSGGHPLKGGKGKKEKKNTDPVYLGCTGREDHLGSDKEYTGGRSGANIHLLREEAWDKGKKYMAIARSGVDGHAFIFNEKPALNLLGQKDKGCQVQCADSSSLSCGCTDGACGGLGPVEGEQHTRRWVVYAVGSRPERPKDDDEGDEW